MDRPKTLSQGDFFVYDPNLSWRNAVWIFKRWYLRKRIMECRTISQLANDLQIQRTYVYGLKKKLLLNERR